MKYGMTPCPVCGFSATIANCRRMPYGMRTRHFCACGHKFTVWRNHSGDVIDQPERPKPKPRMVIRKRPAEPFVMERAKLPRHVLLQLCAEATTPAIKRYLQQQAER